jgi:hypothetical protein
LRQGRPGAILAGVVRYFRVLSLLAVVTALGLGAIALGRSSHASPTRTPPELRRAIQQAAQRLFAAPQLPRVLSAPNPGGTSCFVTTTCSITPCVIPVANAVVPTLPNAATGCPLGDRVPRNFRLIVNH